MKKVLIIAIAFSLLLGASNLFAQNPDVGLTGKGLKAGLNLANFTGSDKPSDVKMRTAFAFGGFLTYSFTDLFAIQPELLYSMKGAKEKVVDQGITVDITEKLSYLEIPVLFKVKLVGAPTFKPNFYVGPGIGFLLSAKEKGESGGISVDVDIKDQLKSTDIGLIGGVGADIPMSAGTITFDIRYEAGLTKVVKAQSGFEAPKMYNSAITFLVGFGF